MEMNTACGDHSKTGYTANCDTCKRIKVEVSIVVLTIDALLAAGYSLVINNGGDDDENEPTTDRDVLLPLLMATDEEHIYCYNNHNKLVGWVYFVYGNDGWDVMSDYTTNLESVIAPINEYADSLCN